METKKITITYDPYKVIYLECLTRLTGIKGTTITQIADTLIEKGHAFEIKTPSQPRKRKIFFLVSAVDFLKKWKGTKRKKALMNMPPEWAPAYHLYKLGISFEIARIESAPEISLTTFRKRCLGFMPENPYFLRKATDTRKKVNRWLRRKGVEITPEPESNPFR